MDEMAVLCSQDMARLPTHDEERVPVLNTALLSNLKPLEGNLLFRNIRVQNVKKRPVSQIQDNECKMFPLVPEAHHGVLNLKDIEQIKVPQNLYLEVEAMAPSKKIKLLNQHDICFNKDILWRLTEKSVFLPFSLNHSWLKGMMSDHLRKQVLRMTFVDYALLVKVEVCIASIFDQNKEESGITTEYIYSELIKDCTFEISHLQFVLSQSNFYIYDSTTELWKKNYINNESDRVAQEIKWRGILAMRKAWTCPGMSKPSCIGQIACLEAVIGGSFMTEHQILQEVCYALHIPRCQEIMDSIQKVLLLSTSFAIFEGKRDDENQRVMHSESNTTHSSSSGKSYLVIHSPPKNKETDGPKEQMSPKTITIADSQNLQSSVCSEIKVFPDLTSTLQVTALPVVAPDTQPHVANTQQIESESPLQPNFALQYPSERVKELKKPFENSNASDKRKTITKLTRPGRRSASQNEPKEQYFVPLQQGWVREVVFRKVSESARCDTYYHPPNRHKSRKLRSRVDVKKFLKNENVEDLTIENFSFCKFPFKFGEPYEIIRNAKLWSAKKMSGNICMNRLSSTTSVKAKNLEKMKSVPSTSAAKPTILPSDDCCRTFHDKHTLKENDGFEVTNEIGETTGYEDWIPFTPSIPNVAKEGNNSEQELHSPKPTYEHQNEDLLKQKDFPMRRDRNATHLMDFRSNCEIQHEIIGICNELNIVEQFNTDLTVIPIPNKNNSSNEIKLANRDLECDIQNGKLYKSQKKGESKCVSYDSSFKSESNLKIFMSKENGEMHSSPSKGEILGMPSSNTIQAQECNSNGRLSDKCGTEFHENLVMPEANLYDKFYIKQEIQTDSETPDCENICEKESIMDPIDIKCEPLIDNPVENNEEIDLSMLGLVSRNCVKSEINCLGPDPIGDNLEEASDGSFPVISNIQSGEDVDERFSFTEQPLRLWNTMPAYPQHIPETIEATVQQPVSLQPSNTSFVPTPPLCGVTSRAQKTPVAEHAVPRKLQEMQCLPPDYNAKMTNRYCNLTVAKQNILPNNHCHKKLPKKIIGLIQNNVAVFQESTSSNASLRTFRKLIMNKSSEKNTFSRQMHNIPGKPKQIFNGKDTNLSKGLCGLVGQPNTSQQSLHTQTSTFSWQINKSSIRQQIIQPHQVPSGQGNNSLRTFRKLKTTETAPLSSKINNNNLLHESSIISQPSTSSEKKSISLRKFRNLTNNNELETTTTGTLEEGNIKTQINDSPLQLKNMPTQPSSGQVTNLISQQKNMPTQPSSGEVANLISQQKNMPTQPSSGEVANLISQQKNMPTQPSSGEVTNLISQQKNMPTQPSSGEVTNLISQQKNMPTQPSSGEVTNLISQQKNMPTQPSSGQITNLISQQKNMPTQPSSGEVTYLISQQKNMPTQPSSGEVANLISQQKNMPTQPSSGEVTNLISQQKNMPTQPSSGEVTNLISQQKNMPTQPSSGQITNLISQQKNMPTQPSSGEVTYLISQQKNMPTQPSSGEVANLISQQKNMPTQPSSGEVTNLISQQKNMPTQPSSGELTNLISQQKNMPTQPSSGQITNLISQQKNMPTQPSSGEVANLISQQKNMPTQPSSGEVTNIISQQKNMPTQPSSGEVANLISQQKNMPTQPSSGEVANLISQQKNMPTQPSSGEVTNLISQQKNMPTQPSSGEVANLISQQKNMPTQPSSGEVTNLISQQKNMPTQPSSGEVTNLISQQKNMPTQPSSGEVANLISQQKNMPTQPSSGEVTNLISQQKNMPTQPSSGERTNLISQQKNLQTLPVTVKGKITKLSQENIILTQPSLNKEINLEFHPKSMTMQTISSGQINNPQTQQNDLLTQLESNGQINTSQTQHKNLQTQASLSDGQLNYLALQQKNMSIQQPTSSAHNSSTPLSTATDPTRS